MSIAPTCPKCLRPYWDDGSQTSVTVCKCKEEQTSTIVLSSADYTTLYMNEINHKLAKILELLENAKEVK